MKRGTRRRDSWAGKPTHKPAPVTDRRIVPLNDGPLRKRATKEFNRAMAKLDKARAQWRRFEQEDRPSFGRWMAATFGALLTELRDNARLINDQQALIEEIEMEMTWSGHRNPLRAYASVMKRRENPEPDDDFEEADERRDEGYSKNGQGGAHDARNARGDEGKDNFDPFEEMGGDIPKEERRALFDDFLRSVFGVNPKHLDKEEYANLFGEFEANMFGGGPRSSPFQVNDGGKPPADRDESRIKEIYRVLVRRLHPDVRADGDATVSGIWHEVQEAYEARNLDRLETLLALTEMQSGKDGGKASLSQMRGALKELNRAFRAMQRSLREARRDPAWNFSQTEYRAPVEKRIRREMEQSLSDQRWMLADLKRTLDAWSRPWRPLAKRPKPASKPNAKRSVRDSDFPDLVQTDLFGF